MTVQIGPLTSADVQSCADLEARLFADDSPWSADGFAAELDKPHCSYLAAWDETGVLVGYAGLARLGSSFFPEYEVHTIGVDPARQRGGIGARLLSGLLDVACADPGPIFLEVRTDNVAAIALYERFGFAVVSRRKGYYQPSGADAFIMRCAVETVEHGVVSR